MREALACLDGTLAHHWILGPPDGPTSTGCCALCGASKVFANVETDYTDYRGYTPLYNKTRLDPKGGRRRA